MQKFWRVFRNSDETHRERYERLRRHPLSLPLAMFFGLLAAGGITLFVLATTHTTTTFHPDINYITIVSHDGQTQIVPTHEPTVGTLLHKLGVPVGPYDRVEPSMSTVIAQDNLRINIYRAVPVTITDGPTTLTAYTAAATPRSAVADAGIMLYAEDGVVSRPARSLIDEQSVGEHITIDRSVPLTLNDYGTQLSMRTHAVTVGQLLESKRITLDPAKDTVIPDLNTPITAGMQVFVTRKGTQIVTQTQAITAPTETVTDASLSFGTTAIRQQGSDGSEVLTYQVNTENGVEVGRTLLQTVVTVQAVPRIIARGLAVSIPADKQAVMAQAGISPSDYKFVDYIASHEGAWCPTKIQGTHTCPEYMNPSDVPAYGGYGIFQATPGSKMQSAGSDWATSAVTQIRWATGYATARYGSWEAAYNHWLSHHNW